MLFDILGPGSWSTLTFIHSPEQIRSESHSRGSDCRLWSSPVVVITGADVSAVALSLILTDNSLLRWEHWNCVDGVSDWTALPLSALLFLSQTEFSSTLLYQPLQRDRETEWGEIYTILNYFPKL